MIPVKVLAVRYLANAAPALCRQPGAPEGHPSLGLLTTDCDDATYIALDAATKAAQVQVAYARSLYAGAANATTPFAGEVIGILAALIMNKTAFRGKPVPFVMELPNYRMPGLKSVALLLWEKAKDFLQRAFTVIFLATIIIWFLQSFDTRLNVVSDSAQSLLALIGKGIAPIFAPLGFADWRCATSLISGFIYSAVHYTAEYIETLNLDLAAGKYHFYEANDGKYAMAMFLLISIPPAIGMLLSAIPTLKYSLTDAEHTRILNELIERRASKNNGSND